MTFPRVESDLLMAAPSFSRSPVAPVESARSLTEEEVRKRGRGACMDTRAAQHVKCVFTCMTCEVIGGLTVWKC